MSPDLQLVWDYIALEDRKKRGDTHETIPPKKKLRVSTRHVRDLSADPAVLPIELSLPANGHEYKKLEVEKLLSTYKKWSRQMAYVMNKMIELKSVPCGIHKLCHLVNDTNVDKLVLDMEWLSPCDSRPPIVTVDEIKAIANSMERKSGCVWSKAKVS
jgi:hypothetical protein